MILVRLIGSTSRKSGIDGRKQPLHRPLRQVQHAGNFDLRVASAEEPDGVSEIARPGLDGIDELDIFRAAVTRVDLRHAPCRHAHPAASCPLDRPVPPVLDLAFGHVSRQVAEFQKQPVDDLGDGPLDPGDLSELAATAATSAGSS